MKTKHILVLSIFLYLLSACKYEDGPVISLRSRDKRIMRTWELKERKVNGAKTALTIYETLKFEKFGRFAASYRDSFGNVSEYYGGWNFLNNDEKISFNKTRLYTDSTGQLQEEVYQVIGRIKRLTTKDFWIEYDDYDFNKVEDKYEAL